MGGSDDIVSLDILGSTARAVGDRVQVVFDGDGLPKRLAAGSGGDWVVAAIEPLEHGDGLAPAAHVGVTLTLRRVYPRR